MQLNVIDTTMKKILITTIFAICIIPVLGNEITNVIGDQDQVENIYTEEEINRSDVTMVGVENMDNRALNTQPIKKDNTKKYIIIGVIIGVVGYAVYRKKQKEKRIKDVVIPSFCPTSKRYVTLTLNDVLEASTSCMGNGADEMNMWRMCAMPDNLKSQLTASLINISYNEETTIIVAGSKKGDIVYAQIYCADTLDEKLDAMLNDNKLIKIKLPM